MSSYNRRFDKKHKTSSFVNINSTKPEKAVILNPVEEWAKKELAKAKAEKEARDARLAQETKYRKTSERLLATTERLLATSERLRTAAEKRQKAAEKRQTAKNARLDKIWDEYIRQKEAGIYKPLKIGGCSTNVRREEMCFFQGVYPLRRHGTQICSICSRNKTAVLRHNPENPTDQETYTCFICSEPVGWIYYCPDCRDRRRY
jgi:hypothetical protein